MPEATVAVIALKFVGFGLEMKNIFKDPFVQSCLIALMLIGPLIFVAWLIGFLEK